MRGSSSTFESLLIGTDSKVGERTRGGASEPIRPKLGKHYLADLCKKVQRTQSTS